MNLKTLTIADKKIFEEYLTFDEHQLSVYALANIYIWKALFKIYWLIIEDSLSIFFQDKIGCFLYLPPLARKLNPTVIGEVFRIMDGLNPNKEISRIENVEKGALDFYRSLGYAVGEKPPEYLCRRVALAQLKGEKFKSKRASVNYFIRHYNFEYLEFSSKYYDEALRLYHLWIKQRQDKTNDSLYQGMLADSLSCFKISLDHYRDLGFIARIVKVDNEVKGFTLGFKLNHNTFCVLHEVTDLSIKGLAQFIFREFCAELKNYCYINIMDDSGLQNLKKVKLSYHPDKLIPAYIVSRENA